MRLLQAAALALVMACLAWPAPALGQKADWTFMVYNAVDNDLESAGIGDFNEMAAIGSTSDVNILVQLDRSSGYDTSYTNWKGGKRFRVETGMPPTAAYAVEDLGVVNMGDPATLRDFIEWSVQTYPADRYALVLLNHGGGWRSPVLQPATYRAVAWDDSSGGDALYTKEILSAIEDSGVHLDLVGFDACVMGMVEVAYELRTVADVMVASEENEPGEGWPYTAILQALTDSPRQSASDLATTIVNAYHDYYAPPYPYADEYLVTQSAIDLSKIGEAVDRVGLLAQAMTSAPSNKSTIGIRAWSALDAYEDAIIANRSEYPDATGLSIFFPPTGDLFDYMEYADYTGENIGFAADAGWRDFLDYYTTSGHADWIGLARKSATPFEVGYYTDLGEFLADLGAASGVPDSGGEDDLTGWWWASSEPGTGFALERQGNRIYLAWYTYDHSGAPRWYASLLEKSGETLFTGMLYTFTGSPLSGFTPGAVGQPMGNVTFRRISGDHAQVLWNLGGGSGSETISRTLVDWFGKTESEHDIDGWWWSPEYDGLGVFIEAHAEAAFAAWYFYDDEGKSCWATLGGWPGSLPAGETLLSDMLYVFDHGQVPGGSHVEPGSKPLGQGSIQIIDESRIQFTGEGLSMELTRFQFGD